MYNEYGLLTATRTTFQGNTSSTNAERPRNRQRRTPPSSRAASPTTPQKANSGGAVFNDDTMSIIASTLYHNVAGQRGGGITSISGINNGLHTVVTIDRSTLFQNQAPQGGNIYIEKDGSSSVLTAAFSTFASNLGAGATSTMRPGVISAPGHSHGEPGRGRQQRQLRRDHHGRRLQPGRSRFVPVRQHVAEQHRPGTAHVRLPRRSHGDAEPEHLQPGAQLGAGRRVVAHRLRTPISAATRGRPPTTSVATSGRTSCHS